MSTSEPTLLIVDGHNLLRRIYGAIKGDDSEEKASEAFRRARGSFVNVRRLIPHTHFATVFDAGGKCFRHDIYEAYKANRKPTPEVFTRALTGFKEELAMQGLCTLTVPGVEADDTMTTLGVRAVGRGFRVVIVSNDKDMAWTLCKGVEVYNYFDKQWITPDVIREKFEVEPSQLTDWLAMVGDDNDGIPGIDKVGRKSVPPLLKRYGTLEGVLAHAWDIQGSLGVNIRKGADSARLSYELAKMREDVELGVKPSEMRAPPAQ